ncbi:MAG: hypothetical protein R2705_09965 [Ilumatobacteraceae bacterium]
MQRRSRTVMGAALLAAVLTWSGAGSDRAGRRRPLPAEPPVPEAILVGDSVLRSVVVTPAAESALSARHSVLVDAEVCRRLVTTSCTAQGLTPNTALDALVAHEGDFGDVLVVEAGYNDASISSAVDQLMAEARRQGVRTVVWLTYHEGGTYAGAYRSHNAVLATKAAEYDELVVADFHGYAHPHPEWFASDGLHLNSAGALGLAEFLGDVLDRATASEPSERCAPSHVASPAVQSTGEWVSTDGGIHRLDQAVRLVDTRPYLLPPGGDRLLGVQVVGRAGIPASASAALVTVTAVDACATNYVTAYPCGAAIPEASMVNLAVHETVANAAIVRLGPTGALCLRSDRPADLLVDVAGWIGPDGAPLALEAPVRMVDTRFGAQQLLRVVQRAVDAGGTLSIPMGSAVGGAHTVAINLTAVEPEAAGFLSVSPGPCTSDVPSSSNLNVSANRTAAAAAFSALGDDGSLCVYSSTRTDVIVDLAATDAVDGSTTVALLRPVSPRRLLDTRPTGPASTARVHLDLGDPELGAPPGAVGAVLDIVGTDVQQGGYVTAGPCADGPLAYVSNLNVERGTTVANLATVAANGAGAICLDRSAPMALVIDVEAWLIETATTAQNPDDPSPTG